MGHYAWTLPLLQNDGKSIWRNRVDFPGNPHHRTCCARLYPRRKATSILIASTLYLSLVLFILFYITQYVPLINAGFFFLLLTPILSRYYDVATPGKENAWIRWGALILIFAGTLGLLMAFLYNNYLNVITFIFYISCMVYYFVNLYLFKQDSDERNLKNWLIDHPEDIQTIH